jgi:riboflavin synthase
MFTGLVEALGTVRNVFDDGAGGNVLVIDEPALAPQLVAGESVAVNGACLTVVGRDAESALEPAAPARESIRFQVGPETLLKTNLGALQIGSRVNLERSLRVGDRLGGHFVQGHVDGVGQIAERIIQGEWETVRFLCPAALTVLMVPKGSIAVDGVSLTLVEAGSDFFTVMLIPHTQANTTLGFKKVGDAVNLEADMLVKHVQKLLAHS